MDCGRRSLGSERRLGELSSREVGAVVWLCKNGGVCWRRRGRAVSLRCCLSPENGFIIIQWVREESKSPESGLNAGYWGWTPEIGVRMGMTPYIVCSTVCGLQLYKSSLFLRFEIFIYLFFEA